MFDIKLRDRIQVAIYLDFTIFPSNYFFVILKSK